MPDLDLHMPEGATFDWVVARPGAIVLVIVIGLVARWLIHRVINRVVRRASEGSVPTILARGRAGEILKDLRPSSGERRRQRAQTMGGLLKSITTGIIAAIVLLEILDQLGINIAPLIASAGIVGVALGFGAQTLVKDFISGVFMIMEDQYGVGDIIDLGEATGTVEAVGLRVTRLRDVNGTVWYVRNGEVVRVGNMSQNWARTVLDITVGYESDIDEVQKLLKQIATEMWHDAAFREVILEEPEVWGVQTFDHDGVVIRVALKTVPMQQWAVGRAMRARIKNRFDAAGIRQPSFSWPPTNRTQQ